MLPTIRGLWSIADELVSFLALKLVQLIAIQQQPYSLFFPFFEIFFFFLFLFNVYSFLKQKKKREI